MLGLFKIEIIIFVYKVLDQSKMLCFYYHEQPHYILSNFYPHIPGKKLKSLKIIYEGLEYPTSEHLYQALKFENKTPEEKEWREHIRTSSTPGIAKHLGHQYNTKKYKWQQTTTLLVEKYRNNIRYAGNVKDDYFRVEIMEIAVRTKLNSNNEFREYLLNTFPNKLMEDTKSDWGWNKGWLGLVLEKVRDESKYKVEMS